MSENHKRAKFIKGSFNKTQKVKFINSCDAMLHARSLGESFGLSCAEFAIKNKPILTYGYCRQRAHFEICKNNIIPYYSYKDLSTKIINSIERVIRVKDNSDIVSLHEPYFENTNAWRYVKECIDTEWVSSAGKYVDLFSSVTSADNAEARFYRKTGYSINVKPTIIGLQKDNLPYKGFVFIGLIKVGNDPKVIESLYEPI